MEGVELFLLEFYLVSMMSDPVSCKEQSFTVAFMTNVASYGTCENLQLFFAATETTNCLIRVPKTSFQTRVFTVETSDVMEQQLPRDLALTGCGVEQKGISVTCNNTVRLYGINFCSKTTDSFSVIPDSHLGCEYFAFTVSPTTRHSQVAVVSLVDNTTVTVHLRCSDCNVTMDNVTYISGSLISVMLNAYEALQIQSRGNLAGAYITSNYPVSVFSGNEMSSITGISSSRPEHLVLHVPPLISWGRKFAVIPFKCDNLFLMAGESFTDVNITCTGRSIQYINISKAGDFIQKTLSPDECCFVEANKPVLAVQTLEKEPSFLPMTPIDQYSSNYSFKVPYSYEETYFIYVIEESVASDLTLDSSVNQLSRNNSKPIPGTTLIWGYFEITDNIHHVTHPYAKFNGVLFGFKWTESYAISLGWNWKKLTPTLDTTYDGLTSTIEPTKYTHQTMTSATVSSHQGLPSATETSDRYLTTVTDKSYLILTPTTETSDQNLPSATETRDQSFTSATETSDQSLTSATDLRDQSLTSATDFRDQSLHLATETSDRYLTTVSKQSHLILTPATETSDQSLTSATETSGRSLTTATDTSHHNLTPASETSHHSLTSATETSYHSLPSVIETSFESWTSSLGTPYHSFTWTVETPKHSVASALKTSFGSSIASAETPDYAFTSIVETPYQRLESVLETYYQSSIPGVETPYESSTSAVETSYYSLTSTVQTSYGSTSALETPYQMLASAVETPHQSWTLAAESPAMAIDTTDYSLPSVHGIPNQSSTSTKESAYQMPTSTHDTHYHMTNAPNVSTTQVTAPRVSTSDQATNKSCVNQTTQQDCNCKCSCGTKETQWTGLLNRKIPKEELVKLVREDFERNNDKPQERFPNGPNEDLSNE